ncbi:MAG: hypothetical protein LBM13_03075 [Candidatus Ancillula sp.]|nr:hypothetical protein [Candidatus Ancillula sp.]
MKKSEFNLFLAALGTGVWGIFSGFISVFLHRILINWYLPVGFILTFVFLFASACVIRYLVEKSGKYFTLGYAIFASFTIYCISEYAGKSGDFMILGKSLTGEKSYAGILGYVLLFGSIIPPFIAYLLPEKLFEKGDIKTDPNIIPKEAYFDQDFNLMFDIAKKAEEIALPAFLNREFNVELKADTTPVTEVDKNVELMARELISNTFPDDEILGEEFKQSENVNSNRRWIIDPIDGTKNYVRGVPIWATLIGLEIDGEVSKSVVVAPALKRIWWGINYGSLQEAWCSFDNRQAKNISVSKVNEIEDINMSISSRGGWVEAGDKYLKWFDNLSSKIKRQRGFGDFYSYMLLAEGAVDLVAEPDLELYDIAALIPIVEGAGGVFADIEGEKWTSKNGIKSGLATTSQDLLQKVLENE